MARRRSLSPTGASWARRSTATACVRDAGSRRRRPRRPRLRVRPSGRAARAGQAARPAAAGQAVPRRPAARADRRGRGGQARGRWTPALRRVVRAQRRAVLRPAAVQRSHALRPADETAPEGVRLLPGGPARAAHADGGRRGRADRLDGQRPSLAVLSDQAPPLFSYFKQLFAQVTNPPIDPIREES